MLVSIIFITVCKRCIATSSDAAYFPALMALLRSLRRTNPSIPVVVFDGGLTPRQRRISSRFADLLPKKPFIELENRGKFAYIGNTTLLKFEVSELEHEKVLYLDVDMVVRCQLDELFSFPKGKVGIVNEVNALKNMFRPRHREILRETFDVEWEKPGFNAGLFVLRPAEWRELKNKAIGMVKKFGGNVFSKTKDQQLLNLLFSGKTHELDEKFNHSPFYDEEKEPSPAIIHYLTGIKPWHKEYPSGHRYAEFRSNLSFLEYPEILTVDMYRFVRKYGLRIL